MITPRLRQAFTAIIRKAHDMSNETTIESIRHLFRAHCRTRHGSKLGSMTGTRRSIDSFKSAVEKAIACELFGYQKGKLEKSCEAVK